MNIIIQMKKFSKGLEKRELRERVWVQWVVKRFLKGEVGKKGKGEKIEYFPQIMKIIG